MNIYIMLLVLAAFPPAQPPATQNMASTLLPPKIFPTFSETSACCSVHELKFLMIMLSSADSFGARSIEATYYQNIKIMS